MLRRTSAFVFVGARVYLPPLFGFPWILSSESRLINGLHGENRRNFFRSPFSLESPRRRGRLQFQQGQRQDHSLGKLKLFSDFLQLIVIRAVPSLAASTQKLRDLDLCLLSSASLSKHGKIKRL
jgi:hypothetical protein